MTTVVSIMLSDIVPLRERGTWQGVINIIFASGAGCGAPLGRESALFIEEYIITWRFKVACCLTL